MLLEIKNLYLVVGATFAYFSVTKTANNTTNIEGSTAAKETLITISEATEKLSLTLSANDMAKGNQGTYYATNDEEGGNSGSDGSVYTSQGQYSKANLGSVTITKPVDGVNYSCKFTVSVEDKASQNSMVEALKEHATDYEFKVYGTGVGGSDINEKSFDLNALQPITFDVDLTSQGITEGTYYAEFAVKNTDADQSLYLSGKTLNLTLKTDITCDEKNVEP